MLNITINNKAIQVEEGTTILQAARDNGIYIYLYLGQCKCQ